MAIITISRGTFSGGQRLAECIAQRLEYRCLGREVLVEAAREYGVPDQKLSEALTKRPGFLEFLTRERKHYLACIRATLCKEAKNGNLIYHGHAGHLLLRGIPDVLRVRVVANMEFRISALTDHHMVSREQAVQYIKKMDDERVRWTRFLYHQDWKDPALYDVVINLDRVSLHDACETVCHVANMEQFQVTPRWQKTMDDLALSSHLTAIIANNKSISGQIEIEADGGVVTIGGTVESLSDADRVRMIVRNEPGVKEINSQMRVRLVGIPADAIPWES
jgi:cytidylate kinase